jgi:hypothetical protein
MTAMMGGNLFDMLDAPRRQSAGGHDASLIARGATVQSIAANRLAET